MESTPLKQAAVSSLRNSLLLALATGVFLGLAAIIIILTDKNLDKLSQLPTVSPAAATSVTNSPATTQVTPSASPTTVPAPALSPITDQTKIPILMYHYIREHNNPFDKMGAGLSVSPATFAKQLADIKAAGYTTITLADLTNPTGIPEKSIILTFDDGYADAYTQALPALQKEGMTGVFYLVSGFLGKSGYLTADHTKELVTAGMEVGAHTVDHRDLSKMDSAKQRNELEQSKQQLEAIIGKTVDAFCYPAGKYNQTTVDLAKELGYTTATTTKTGIATGADLAATPHELVRIRVSNSTDVLKVLGEKR